jgi:hypothetical protein
MRSLLAAATAAALLVVAFPQPAQAAGVTVAGYDFNGRSGALRDDAGRGHTMRLIAARGGKVRPVVHGSGQALQFPAKCTGGKCPTAVLQTGHSADLNPGSRALAYGATVRLARSQTSKGQNVVQKGYSATSSQYKLQIDGAAGHPSCVLVDVRRPVIRMVRSSVTIADGRWHRVRCQRIGTRLEVYVDNVPRGRTAVPSNLNVSNDLPLSIGAKGAYRDNDQFNGILDNVWVRIST